MIYDTKCIIIYIYKQMNKDDIQLYNKKKQQWYFSKTGFSVDIQSIGRNSATVVLRSKKTEKEIHKGVWLKTDTLEFESGNFTNIYDLYWNKSIEALEPEIYSEQHPFYLADYVCNNSSVIAALNGSYFFLIDVEDRNPIDYSYNFCIRNGKIRGLPTSDDPILYVENNNIISREIEATGTVQIGKKIVEWIGSDSAAIHSSTSPIAILYNSASSKLLKPYDPKTGVRMAILDNENIHTPKDNEKIDLIITANAMDQLVVSDIKIGGNTHFFDGLFILQIDKKNNTYSIGDVVVPLTLDKLHLKNVTSSISIGKSVSDPYYFTSERIHSRDARSIIALDVHGNYHFIVFDGSKYIPKFKGASAQDMAKYFPKDKFVWAYFLDGGSSSKIIYKDDHAYNFLANELAFKKITLDTFLWDWKRHRKMESCITLKKRLSSHCF